MRKNSLVWRFFDRVESERGICTAVICKLCEVQYRFFGNTTNLRVHLSRKHPIQWELAHEDPNISFTTEEDSPEGGHVKKKRKSKITMEDDDSDSGTHNDGDTLIVKGSDEEWLEELYEKIEYPQPKTFRIKRRIKREVEDDTECNYTKDIESTHLEQETEVKDEYSAFGEYIATKLRKLKTARTRGNIQQIITTVLWQAEYGVYDNADTVKNLLVSFSPNINVNLGETTVPDASIQVEMIPNESEQFMN